MLRSVLFDFDGTLADTLGLTVDIYNELAARNGFAPIAAAEVAGLSRLPIPERCRRLGVPLWKLPALKPYVTRRFRERIGEVRLFGGIPGLLAELKGMGLYIGVLSSNDEGVIRQVLHDCGAAAHIDDVLPSSSLFGKHGPLRACKKARGGELLYVGDELRDLEACRKAGVLAASACWGFDHPELLRAREPDLLAESPEGIAVWVRERLLAR